MTPCVRAQFGHCDSFSPRQLLATGFSKSARAEQSDSAVETRNAPLMVGMSAHEVDSRKVELALTGGAFGDLEDPRRVRIGQFLDFFALLGRFGPIRGDERLVLPDSRGVSNLGSPLGGTATETHRIGSLLLSEQLPFQVLAHEAEACRVVLAEELDDLNGRHELALIDLVEDLDHFGLMPRE